MGLGSIWINSLGPDIVCSLWIDVEDVYYIMDTDTNKTGRLGSAFLLSQQTIWNIPFRFFHPFGWERSRSLLRRRDLSLRLRLHLYGIWSVSLCVIVSHQIHREISTTWVSGSVICHASDGPFYTHTWSDHRKFMMRILIVWGWIDSSDLSLASDQLNVRPRLRPNQLRGSGIP